jgi:ATP-dependent Lon protease
MMSPMTAERPWRNFIDTLLGMARRRRQINKDLANAVKVLDADSLLVSRRSGTDRRISVVQQRVDKLKAPILCLVGAPGVGKTSRQSIARATNRKFVRMRWAAYATRQKFVVRRTYIGSMPGKILQNMTKVGVKNPLFLLDEVDSEGMDFRGDPSSALLEVLDPNRTTHSSITTSKWNTTCRT